MSALAAASELIFLVTLRAAQPSAAVLQQCYWSRLVTSRMENQTLKGELFNRLVVLIGAEEALILGRCTNSEIDAELVRCPDNRLHECHQLSLDNRVHQLVVDQGQPGPERVLNDNSRLDSATRSTVGISSYGKVTPYPGQKPSCCFRQPSQDQMKPCCCSRAQAET